MDSGDNDGNQEYVASNQSDGLPMDDDGAVEGEAERKRLKKLSKKDKKHKKDKKDKKKKDKKKKSKYPDGDEPIDTEQVE